MRHWQKRYPKYTFAALLKEREEDLAFFDPCIEKGLVGKFESSYQGAPAFWSVSAVWTGL